MADIAALEAQYKQAVALHQQGALAQAREIYSAILVHLPDHAAVLMLSGMAAVQMHDYAAGAAALEHVVALEPGNADAWFNHGLALLHLGQNAAAAESFGRTTALQPGNADAHNNQAIALRALARHAEALASYDKALALRPQSAETLNNRGVTLADLERYQESAASCAAAVALKPDYVEAHNNLGNALRMMKRYDEALASYGRSIALDPADAEAFNNRGLTYSDIKQYQAALADYARATELRPAYAEAFNNRAVCLVEMHDYESALADYRKAAALKPDYAEAHVNLGHLFNDLKRYEDAVASYRAARRVKPDTVFLQGHLIYTQMMNCEWDGLDADIADLHRRMAQGERATTPFPALTLTDDPALQHRAIDAWVRAKYAAPVSAPRGGGDGDEKIRIGYFSMDFREHPIAALTAGLFEAHDRGAFEIYAFSYGPDRQDGMRLRLERAFDKFIDVRTMPDAEVVGLAREMRLDIAVDLAGYTKDARIGIFAGRAAPVQAHYLGFPGTLAAPHMDYIIGDETVIPPDARAHYAEKVLSLPHFQVNDDKRPRPDMTFSRAGLGLPDNAFVFCCFNNTYKFSPDVFATWMRILHRVPGSVLFLYADSELAGANLRRAAAAHGVALERLIFGKRLDMAGYLARYKAADLFLDTLPYNAGTTATDALWMDLPVLTCTGGAFASRMAASLLHALDLPELITHTLKDYEDRAVALATHAPDMAALKSKLARNRVTSPLFNTAAFTRTLEEGYTRMCERARAGLPPDHIIIS